MYFHFPVTGVVTQLSDADAHKKMDEISEQWEDETNEWGKLYLGVYDWAYTEEPFEIHVPKLREGGEIPQNQTIIKVFENPIYGDCFLKVDPAKATQLQSLIASINN